MVLSMKGSVHGRILVGILLLLGCFHGYPQDLQDKAYQGWQAGVARAIITPVEYMWMAGFAAREAPANGKLHDLWVKALALEDVRGNKGLLITSDIIGFDRSLSQSICDELQAEFALNRADIVLSSSHTHSGPVLNNNLLGIYPPFNEEQLDQISEYREFLKDQVLVVAKRAFASRSAAKLSAGVGMARFAVNRRESGWEGDVLYKPEVKGPSDHAVPVIKITDDEDELIAVVFGYACHPTSLSINKWSGDYPGYAQLELEDLYPGATAMFFTAFGADQNPFPRGGILQTEQYGRELAIAVDRVLKDSLRMLSPSLTATYREIELNIAPPPDDEELDQIIEAGAGWERRWALGIKEKKSLGEDLPDAYPHYPIQTWQLGSQIMIVLGGEVVVDYTLRLREIHGNDLIFMGYANDVMTYIPSERVLKEGGYEGKSAMWVYGHRGTWEPGLEDKIIHEVAQQIDFLLKEGQGK